MRRDLLGCDVSGYSDLLGLAGHLLGVLLADERQYQGRLADTPVADEEDPDVALRRNVSLHHPAGHDRSTRAAPLAPAQSAQFAEQAMVLSRPKRIAEV